METEKAGRVALSFDQIIGHKRRGFEGSEMAQGNIAGVRRDRLSVLRAREAVRYAQGRPKSAGALRVGAAAYLDGVPMHWMKDWPMPFPMLVAQAKGARLTDIDGFEVDDFCLGDTGSMFGHSPKPVVRAIVSQAGAGLTYMLPTVEAMEVGALLCAQFGDFRWQ